MLLDAHNRYYRWDGLARGDEAWLATFNRVYLLDDLYSRREYDWVLYMDPDAVIINATRRAEDFLDDGYPLVLAQGGKEKEGVWWDLNIGGWATLCTDERWPWFVAPHLPLPCVQRAFACDICVGADRSGCS
jgi:hypothetical protein